MRPILQTRLPYDPFKPRPLPGIAPLEPEAWLRVDEAFAGQMARRETLILEQRDAVIALGPRARPAAEELLDLVIAAQLDKPGFAPEAGAIRRPDGGVVAIDRTDPLASIGRLAQEDFCILEKRAGDDEHVLTGAVLCFPASWSLAEKFLRPLIAIHNPVEAYDDGIAKRVQRLFDGVRVGRPLWRFNALWYASGELHQPRREDDRRVERHDETAAYLRSELQTLRRLPQTGAVIFTIHTFVLRAADVPGRG
jgi:hypothetical protein